MASGSSKMRVRQLQRRKEIITAFQQAQRKGQQQQQQGQGGGADAK